MAGRLLADWGADVVHVDYVTRKAIEARRVATEKILAFQVPVLMHKTLRAVIRERLCWIFLKIAARMIISRSLEKADVLLSNFRPYELEKFGLQYETLSKTYPRLICANLTGYGKKGPDRNAPAYGQIAGDARSGLLHSLQVPGSIPSSNLRYYGRSYNCFEFGLWYYDSSAHSREKGVGQEVEVSLFNSMVFAVSGDIAATITTGRRRRTVERKRSPQCIRVYVRDEG